MSPFPRPAPGRRKCAFCGARATHQGYRIMPPPKTSFWTFSCGRHKESGPWEPVVEARPSSDASAHVRGRPLPPSTAPATQSAFDGFGTTYRERLLEEERRRYVARRERADRAGQAILNAELRR